MNSRLIHKILSSDPVVAPSFYGVFPRDRLPDRVMTKCALVANMDQSSGPGTHWVAFFIDEDRTCIYFDSYGQPPQLHAFKEFIDRHSVDWEFNGIRLQGSLSSACGPFCVYFLLHVCRGYSMGEIVKAFDGHDDNDEAVTEFVNSRFDIKIPVLDLCYVIDQLGI